MSNSNTTTQHLILGTDGMECNFCEQVIPWHELKSHQCQGVLKKEEHMTLNVRICPICGNHYNIYGRIVCRECDEQVDWLGTPTFIEWPPTPPSLNRRKAEQ